MRKLWIIVILFSIEKVFCQNFEVSISKDSIFIGEQFELRVSVESPQALSLKVLKDSLQRSFPKELEVVQFKTKTRKKSDAFTYELQWRITCFEPGSYIIFLQNIKFQSKEFTLPPQNLEVMDYPVDSTKIPLYDIKNIETIELSFWEKWGETILLALLALGLLSLMIYFIRKNILKKKRKMESEAPKEPYLIAHKAISEGWSLYQKDEKNIRKAFVIATDALREYLHEAFRYPSLVLLSDDLIDYMYKHPKFSENEIKRVVDFLRISDKVKFAKYRPEKSLVEQSFSEIFQFLEQTRLLQWILNPQEHIRSLFDEPQNPNQP